MKKVISYSCKLCLIFGILSMSGCSTLKFSGNRDDKGPKPEDTKFQIEHRTPRQEYRPFVAPRRPAPVQEVLIVEPESEPQETIVVIPEPQKVVSSFHTIKKGDTLSMIAKMYGIKLSDLRAANPNVDEKKLKIGTKLTLPNISEEEAKRISTPTTYKVKKGDCLSTIAKKHGVSVKAIRLSNGMTSDKIIAGKTLKIPAKGSMYESMPDNVKSTTNANSNSKSTNSTKNKNKFSGHLDITKDGYYIVQSGDTLGAIAKKAGISVFDLQDLNDIADPTKIQIGQKILVKNAGQTVTRASINSAKQQEIISSDTIAIPQPPMIDNTASKYEFLDDADFFNNVDDIPVVQVQ